MRKQKAGPEWRFAEKSFRASAKTQYLTLERLPCWYDVWHP
jgi:hypothetical protein